jgi:hypothetical protein
MGRVAFGRHYFEDPSVAFTCAAEYDRLWNRIAERTARGEWFYRAREVVLAEEMADIATAFGRPVADRVSRAIQHTSPDRLPRWARRAARDLRCRQTMEHLRATRGRVGFLNAVSLFLTGAHWR